MKKAIVVVALTVFSAAQFSCGAKQASKPAMQTQEEKISYMIGVDIGNSLKGLDTKIDMNALEWGIKDILEKRPQLLNDSVLMKIKQEFSMQMQQKQMAKMQESTTKNTKEGDTFLAENKKKATVKTTASGLQYEVVKEGKGPKPKASDKVKVHYVGTLLDGKEFDNSITRGQPAEFPLGNVIPGWTEGLQLMTVGSKYKFYIPSNLAYGERGAPQGGIGPNATLIFDVELLEILK